MFKAMKNIAKTAVAPAKVDLNLEIFTPEMAPGEMVQGKVIVVVTNGPVDGIKIYSKTYIHFSSFLLILYAPHYYASLNRTKLQKTHIHPCNHSIYVLCQCIKMELSLPKI
jgi:hypothetical protein